MTEKYILEHPDIEDISNVRDTILAYRRFEESKRKFLYNRSLVQSRYRCMKNKL